MTTFKTILATAVAVALGATVLTSTTAFARFLPLTHLPPGAQANPGAVPGNIITPGLPGAFGNIAPTRPSVDGKDHVICNDPRRCNKG